jgi:hypothetical protein
MMSMAALLQQCSAALQLFGDVSLTWMVMCAMTTQEGFGGFPWTTNTTFPGRKDPNELTSSAEGIVESDGTVPQCEVTVQLSTPYNTTGGLVATVLNLIFTNWCVCASCGSRSCLVLDAA